MHTSREATTPSHLAIETKEPPAPRHQQLLAAFREFYQPKAIIHCLERFLQGDIEAESDLFTYLEFALPDVMKVITGWAEINNWRYILNNEDSHHLTARKWTWLGIMYKFGICTPPDLKKAINCFQKASQDDSLGLMFLIQLTEKNTSKKIELLKEINTPIALYKLAEIFRAQKNANKQLKECLEKAAGNNLSQAIEKLSDHYLTGAFDFPKNLKNAYTYGEKAISRGQPPALINISIMYYNGSIDTPQDINIAKQLFEACTQFKSFVPHLYLATINSAMGNANETVKHSYQACTMGADKIYLEEHKEWHWVMFQKEQKSAEEANPHIIYYATRFLQLIGDEKQKNATKMAFKKLDLGIVSQIAAETGETLESLGALILPDSTEREQLLIKFHCLFEGIPCLSKDLLETIFQYDGFPLPLITQSILVNHAQKELAAKEWLSVQKKHALMLFGKETAEKIAPIIQEVEEYKTSAQSAVPKIAPLLTAPRA